MHKIVISINTQDDAIQQRAIDNIARLTEHFGHSETLIEMVSYGPGLVFLTQKSAFLQEIAGAIQTKGLTFSACANTMRKIEAKTGKKPELIDGVGIVPGGVIRLVELQEQGYAYISP